MFVAVIFHFSSARLVHVMSFVGLCDLYVVYRCGKKANKCTKLNVLRARAKKSTEIIFVGVIAVLVIKRMDVFCERSALVFVSFLVYIFLPCCAHSSLIVLLW